MQGYGTVSSQIEIYILFKLLVTGAFYYVSVIFSLMCLQVAVCQVVLKVCCFICGLFPTLALVKYQGRWMIVIFDVLSVY